RRQRSVVLRGDLPADAVFLAPDGLIGDPHGHRLAGLGVGGGDAAGGGGRRELAALRNPALAGFDRQREVRVCEEPLELGLDRLGAGHVRAARNEHGGVRLVVADRAAQVVGGDGFHLRLFGGPHGGQYLVGVGRAARREQRNQ